jgi:AAA+ superfamily predicted ATPase
MRLFSKRQQKELTIEDHFILVVDDLASNEGIAKSSLPSISFISEKLEITETQTLILTTIYGWSRHWGKDDITILNLVSKIKKLNKYKTRDDVLELLKKNYLVYSSSGYSGSVINKDQYKASDLLSEILTENKLPDKVKDTGLNSTELIVALSSYIDTYLKPGPRYMTLDFLLEKCNELLDKNKLTTFSQEYRKLINGHRLGDEDQAMILILSSNLIINGIDKSTDDFLLRVYDGDKPWNEYMKKNAKIAFNYEQYPLFTFGILENKGQGFRGDDLYGFTEKTKDLLFSDIELKEDQRDKNLLYPDKIGEKELFYESEFSEKIRELFEFFGESRFKEIQNRLKEKGMKTGFSCLFYGKPGTGKTETVYQIAKATGRPIYSVDLSQIRDKWVGESEKRLKSIFTRYKKMTRRKDTPILLFNEADGIIGTRMKSLDSSVDKMENTMQNILLQELEDFEGILIATTNLEGNLDTAFERRFLYKLEFPKPGPEVRAKIWMSKIDELQGEDAYSLAKEFDLSGGQIDNIARKLLVNQILRGEDKGKPDLELLRRFCKEERLGLGRPEKIGFTQ